MTGEFERIYKTGNDRNLVNSSGEEIGTEDEPLHVKDKNLTTNDLLSLMLMELKIIRTHQEKASNEVFKSTDINK